jgi:hypothetical protein
MSERSKRDPNHISQLVYDEEANANRVKLADTEIAMELSADDGDSIESQPAKLIASAIGCAAEDNNTDVIPALDCKNLREVHVSVNGSGSVQILVSPNDSGDFFYAVGAKDVIHKICARRIKVRSVDVIGDVHLVGRS